MRLLTMYEEGKRFDRRFYEEREGNKFNWLRNDFIVRRNVIKRNESPLHLIAFQGGRFRRWYTK